MPYSKELINEYLIRETFYWSVFTNKTPSPPRFVDSGEMCESFPYRTKALFAFEEIDGTDVCFFGMHVQEYGSDCPLPNQRSEHVNATTHRSSNYG